MLERVWEAGLAKAKDQEGQTSLVGHQRGMWLQLRSIVHKTWSHEMCLKFQFKTLNLDFLFISLIFWCFKFKSQLSEAAIIIQIKNFMLTRFLVHHLQVNIAYMDSYLKNVNL